MDIGSNRKAQNYAGTAPVRRDHRGGFPADLLLCAAVATFRRGTGWSDTPQPVRAGPSEFLKVHPEVECHPNDEEREYVTHTGCGGYDTIGKRILSVRIWQKPGTHREQSYAKCL